LLGLELEAINTPQNKKLEKKKNQNPSKYYYNSIITILKVSTQAKISSFKNPHIIK
jgi:hypothetical protein